MTLPTPDPPGGSGHEEEIERGAAGEHGGTPATGTERDAPRPPEERTRDDASDDA